MAVDTVRKCATPVRKCATPVRKCATPARKCATPARNVNGHPISPPVGQLKIPPLEMAIIVRRSAV